MANTVGSTDIGPHPGAMAIRGFESSAGNARKGKETKTMSDIEVMQGGEGPGIERRELSAVMGGNTEDAEVLGRAMMYGVGEVLVPREWLLDRCEDLGVPERIRPNQPTPHSAYKRAQSRLVTSNTQNGDERTDRRYILFEGMGGGPFRVDLELKSGDGRTNINHLRADVFFPEEVVGVEGGNYVTHELGHFNYDKETQTTKAYKSDDIPGSLEGLWDEMVGRAMDLHERMQSFHTGDDLRHMVYLEMILNSPRDWPDIIPLRDAGAVYFVPEGPLTDVIDALSDIFSEVDERYKEGGKTVEIRTLPVVDDDERREWIENRVEKVMEEGIDDILEEAFGKLDEGEEIDDLVKMVAEELGGKEETVERYNSLLQAQLKVEQYLEGFKAEIEDDDREELVQRVMEQANLEEF